MATVIRDVREMQATAGRLRQQGKRIGVVPTMGFLHEGHLSLIRIARAEADIVITTVFVNPSQFGPGEDLSRYPRNFERDLSLSTEAGTDFMFAPEVDGMYPPEYATHIDVERITGVLEGKSRPGHFRGVATIVAKLFNSTKPDVAVFGQKDAQQIAVVRAMIRDLNFDIRLIVAPIVREPDGLAMSSRNTYLTPQQRAEAIVLSRVLHMAEQRVNEGETDVRKLVDEMRFVINDNSSGVIDYISFADNQTLAECEQIEEGKEILVSLAVRFGSTRLIDNTIIRR
ncbi:MAG: pantoate--beta-alanine ligase [bacterium]